MKQKFLLLFTLVLIIPSLYSELQTIAQANVNLSVKTNDKDSYEKTLICYEDGYAFFKVSNDKLYGIQDLEGKEIVPIKYEDVYSIADRHFFQVRLNGCLGAYSCEGHCVVSPERGYSMVYPQEDEKKFYWIFKKDNKTGILDSRGKEVIPPLYNSVYLTSFYKDTNKRGPTYFFAKDKDYEYFFDMNGNLIAKEEYSNTILGEKRGGIWAKMDKDKCLINGKEIDYNDNTKFDYTFYDDFLSGNNNRKFPIKVSLFGQNSQLYLLEKGNKFGLINIKGGKIAPIEFDKFEPAGSGYLRYKLNGFWGLMNYQGKVLIDTNRGYTSIGDFKSFNKRFSYTMNGYKGECDATGRQISKIKVASSSSSSSSSSSMKSISDKAPQKYNDVLAFDLKGNVKSCEVIEVNALDAIKFLAGDLSKITGSTTNRYSFKSNGQYIPNEGEKIIYEGNILRKIKTGSDEMEYIYNNGRLQNKNFVGEFFGMPAISMIIFTYDRNGMIIKKEFCTGSKTIVTTYSDYKFDSKGNWIKRKCKTNDGLPTGEARIINYY